MSTKLELDADYDSVFDETEAIEEKNRKRKRLDLAEKGESSSDLKQLNHRPTKDFFEEQQRRAEGFRNRYLALNAFERHKKLVNEYLLYYPGSSNQLLKRDTSKDVNDFDIIRKHHRFIWKEEDEKEGSWEKDLAKKYYDKLFKEYGVCDLSRYERNQIAIRWRIQQEVIDGKGQFICASKKCTNSEDLKTWEVNFSYLEENIKKNTLVKLRLCPQCSVKLNFSVKRKEVTKKSKKSTKKHKRKGRKASASSSSDEKDEHDQKEDLTSDQIHQKEKIDEIEAGNIWKAPLVLPELKSRDEEFDEYLDDLFL